MNSSDDEIKKIEEALSETPGSISLRRQLGEALIKAGQFLRAEEELKRVLQYKNNDIKTKMVLAGCYKAQGKIGAAVVVLESLLKNEDVPIEATVMYAELTRNPDVVHKTESNGGNEKLMVTVAPESDELDLRDAEKPRLDFKSVGGMHRVKEEIRMKIILPMTNRDLYKIYGKKAGGGILLYGPPGCGKTHLARATAGEINAAFISVGLNDILDMYLGQSEQKLHHLFEKARNNKPCVLFFDEVDALGANRSDLRKQAGRTIVNQFLMELDGVNDNNEEVLILAATNAPWYLDQAFRRPGRFDRIIFVEPPDQEAREEILRIMLSDKPLDSIDYSLVAKQLKDYSGADIKAVIDIAVEEKLMIAMQKGKAIPVSSNDLIKAIKKVRSTAREWFATARNYAIYANESGLYDDILSYMDIK